MIENAKNKVKETETNVAALRAALAIYHIHSPVSQADATRKIKAIEKCRTVLPKELAEEIEMAYLAGL